MSFLHFALFLMFLLGYWMGRDTNKKPLSISEHGAPILYAWAFVGLLNFLGLGISA